MLDGNLDQLIDCTKNEGSQPAATFIVSVPRRAVPVLEPHQGLTAADRRKSSGIHGQPCLVLPALGLLCDPAALHWWPARWAGPDGVAERPDVFDEHEPGQPDAGKDEAAKGLSTRSRGCIDPRAAGCWPWPLCHALTAD